MKAATPLQDMPTTNPEQKNAHLKAADDLIHTTPDSAQERKIMDTLSGGDCRSTGRQRRKRFIR